MKPPSQPATDPPVTHLFLADPMTTGSGVPALLVSCSESMCGVPPTIGTLFRKYVRCPPLPVYTFFVRCPPPNLVLCLEHFGSVLDSEQNWESGKFQLARWSEAQLVSSSVALLGGGLKNMTMSTHLLKLGERKQSILVIVGEVNTCHYTSLDWNFGMIVLYHFLLKSCLCREIQGLPLVWIVIQLSKFCLLV